MAVVGCRLLHRDAQVDTICITICEVYSCKWSTDMNLFYSLGDSQVFLSLQAWCQIADAVGGSVAGVLATWLFSLDPAAPFAFGAGMACNSVSIFEIPGRVPHLKFGTGIILLLYTVMSLG